MILCTGLSPAWQQILVFDGMRLNAVNRATDARWCASGKVINAARAVVAMHGAAQVLTVLGGASGRGMAAELAASGIACRAIETETATRVCTTLVDRATGAITELVENAHPLTPAEITRFRDAFAEEARAADAIVVSGSLPPGASPAIFRELLGTSPRAAVLDIRGEELLAALECAPLVVKPNREELEQTLGAAMRDEAELLAAMRSLNARGARWVLVTHGSGPIYLTAEQETHRFDALAVADPVNTIGCGDVLAGVMAWAIGRGASVPDAAAWGIAAAAASARALMPAQLNAADVQRLRNQVSAA